ncbi:hypothetical protein E2C01_031021 [Portunus trituberculatus]|uniref:Uncharacterized protein n=1 Tax=Portunus trituberculatus TaxID=210409 RepID=A0A5B7EWI0_PORTR|nr:hypothetical protein [Portunus trituberculatus]
MCCAPAFHRALNRNKVLYNHHKAYTPHHPVNSRSPRNAPRSVEGSCSSVGNQVIFILILIR